MNKTCARCEKTVYPTEELKCLDKVWHKGCFKCQECGMTLNMRTYKGYGKLPYCESHVPKAKHTTMAETPELKRIAENTKLQSNVKYHADFEKSKGKFTQVADDPETLRIKANTKIISNVAYHGDLEKKAHMERQRLINENGELVEVPPPDNYHQQIENYATEMLSSQPAPNLPQKTHYQTPAAQPQYYKPPPKFDNDYYQPPPPQHTNYPTNYNNPPQSQHYAPANSVHASNNSVHASNNSVHSANNAVHQSHNPAHQVPNSVHPGSNSIHPSNNAMHAGSNSVHPGNNSIHAGNNSVHPGNNSIHAGNNSVHQQQKYDEYSYGNFGQYQQQGYGVGSQKIGRIQDYDPLSDGPRAPPSTQRASTTLIYNSTNDARQKGSNQPLQQQSRAIGRVSDLDPVADEPRAPAVATNQRVYIAMYDYEANDSDEVSFREGDLISNVSSIDSGWMTGQVLRTGRTGMLPANYVEPAPALYAA